MDASFNDFDVYQEWTENFVKYSRYEDNERRMYPALGLCGEAGEVAEKVKKHVRDGVVDTDELCWELGDVMWYLARVATEYNIRLSDVVVENVRKLESRRERGVLHGSGDRR